jgi:hypothetical protein
MAESSVQLLDREFYFEFVTVRALFLSGLLTFMGSMIARGWSVYGTKPHEKFDLMHAVGCMHLM